MTIDEAVEKIMELDWGCGCCADASREQLSAGVREIVLALTLEAEDAAQGE